jgi:hypothetical protein
MIAVYSLTTLPTAVDVANYQATRCQEQCKCNRPNQRFRRGLNNHFRTFFPTGLNFLNVFPTEHPPANVTTSSATIQIVYWVVVNIPYLRGMYI